MTKTGLRPLSIGEILDGAFTIYREHFAVLVLTTALCGVPSLIAGFLLPQGFWSLAEAVMGFVSFTALTWMTGELIFGRSVGVGRGIAVGLRKAPRVFVCFVAVGLLFALLGLAGVLVVVGMRQTATTPAVLTVTLVAAVILVMGAFSWLVVRYFAVAQVVVLEGERKFLRRSAALSKGAFWRISTVWTVASLVVVLPSLMIGGGIGVLSGVEEELQAADGQAAAAALVFLATVPLVSWLVNALTTPFTAAIGVVLYIDQRVRKDGLDIELAMAAAEGEPGGAAKSVASA